MPSSKFVAAIEDFAVQAKAKYALGARESLKEVVRRLIDRTPVGVYPETSDHPGMMKGNWLATLDEMSNSYDSTSLDKEGGVTLDRALAAIDSIDLSQPWVLFISNHVPYAVRIEYGWSKQAPEGVVRITAAEFADIVKENFVLGGGGT